MVIRLTLRTVLSVQNVQCVVSRVYLFCLILIYIFHETNLILNPSLPFLYLILRQCPRRLLPARRMDFWIHFICIAILIAISCVLALSVYAHDKYKNHKIPRGSARRPSVTSRDKKYALNTLGASSVYQFFLGTSIYGLAIVLLTLAAQVGMLFVFVNGAEIDLSDDNVDLIYSWKCSRDQDECHDTSDLTWKGWTVFGVLMATHLLKDLINGIKMIVLSAKERHETNTRARYFVGGTLMATVTSFTLYVSTIYNAAIATSKYR